MTNRRTSSAQNPSPTDGRTARRLDSQRRISATIIKLVRRGILDPTANEVARESGLSRALVFRYFRDKESLRRVVVAELEEYGRQLMGGPIHPGLPFDRRVELFIRKQTRLLEGISPFRRATLVHEPYSREVASSQARSRKETRAILQRALEPEIDRLSPAQKRKLLDALHMVLAWPSWETLRKHYGRTVPDARDTIRRVVKAILRDALRPTRKS
jgi:AcrR family transcriptional regulator